MGNKRLAVLVAAWMLLGFLGSILPSSSWAQQAAPAASEEWTPERLEALRRQAAENRQATEQMVEEAKKRLREAGAVPTVGPGGTSPPPAAQLPVTGELPVALGASLAQPAVSPSGLFLRRTSDWFDRPQGIRLRLGGTYATTTRSDKARSGGEKLALHRRVGKAGNWELALPASNRDIVTLTGEGRRETIRPDATGSEAGSNYRQLLTTAGLNWEHFCVRSQHGFTSLFLGASDRFQDGKGGRPDEDIGEFQGEVRFARAFGGGTLTTELRGGYTHTTDSYDGPTAAAILGVHGLRWDLEAGARWARPVSHIGAGEKVVRTDQGAQAALRFHLNQHWDLTLSGGVQVADWDDDRNANFSQRETGEFYGLQLGRRF